MARKSKQVDDSTPSAPVLNSEARKELMRECSTDMRAIQKAREKLNEEAGGVRERLKEADVNLKAFMDGLKMVHQEEVARQAYLDGLREMLALNHIDWQSEMFADDQTGDASGKPDYLKEPDDESATAH